MDAFGNFVVAWSGDGNADDSGVYVQVYDSFGMPVTEAFRANETVWEGQVDPSVSMSANGDFIVTWTSYGNPKGDANVMARSFNYRGESLTGEFMVNTITTSAQNKPSVAVNSDGSYVVAWSSWLPISGYWTVRAQRYDADNQAVGGETQVANSGTREQPAPKVAIDDAGNFTVAWGDYLGLF